MLLISRGVVSNAVARGSARGVPSLPPEVDSLSQGAFLHLAVEAQGYAPQSSTCDPAKYVPPPGEPGEEYLAREQKAAAGLLAVAVLKHAILEE